MSAETDRVIAGIDHALTSDEITDIVDEQLARYDQRTGYDYSIGQPRCAHCGSDEHHLAITERIEEMRDWGLYDETYRYDEDDSRVVCPGTNTPGPVGFRRAHLREQRAEARRDYDRRIAAARADLEGADALDESRYSRIGFTGSGGEVWIAPIAASPFVPMPWELLREMLSAATLALGSVVDITTSTAAAIFGAVDALPPAPAVDPERLIVRLFTEAGRPVRFGRKARVVSYEQTVTGFTVEIDGRFTRSFGVPHRILLEGPGGPRERIAGIVTELSSTPGGPIRIEAASEHRRLPTVYTEPEN